MAFYLITRAIVLFLLFKWIEKDFFVVPREITNFWIVFPIALICVDFTKFCTHYLLHRHPLLWKIHITHHTATHLEPNVAFRRHFLEYPFYFATGLGGMIAMVAIFNISPMPFFWAFQVSAAWNTFTHANIKISPFFLKYVGFIFYPTNHRAHHTCSYGQKNFGVIFTWWDQLLGTYQKNCDSDEKLGVAGIMDSYPKDFIGQQLYPFKRMR